MSGQDFKEMKSCPMKGTIKMNCGVGLLVNIPTICSSILGAEDREHYLIELGQLHVCLSASDSGGTATKVAVLRFVQYCHDATLQVALHFPWSKINSSAH